MQVTHPFHPLAGLEFAFVKHRRNWRQDRVYFCEEEGELAGLAAGGVDRDGGCRPFAVVNRRSSQANAHSAPRLRVARARPTDCELTGCAADVAWRFAACVSHA